MPRKFDARHTPADLRLPFQHTRAEPARRKQRGHGQPADAAAHYDYVIARRHTRLI
jgi:hypothetical protein